MKEMPNFFDPNQSILIIDMFMNKFKEDIKDLFPDQYHQFDLDNLFAQKIFWLNHLSQFSWLKQEVSEMNDDLDFDNDIFEILTDSEYSQDFLEGLNTDKSFKEICSSILTIYEKQIGFIQKYHVEKKTDHISDEYRLNQDLGDINNKIGGTPIAIEPSTILYLAGNDQNYQRIQQALEIINALAPDAYQRLNTFTKYLVPLNENGMVSFSSDALPFYSCINFHERDNVDLLDDLLHENGHHQLNFYLYNYDLINEQDPNLYFSPWRECLRPLRGIYHGYCTFYWAYDLFKNLISHPECIKYFSASEINKIAQRYLEEREMLLITKEELIKAKEHGYISEEGMQIVKKLHSRIENDDELPTKVINDFNLQGHIDEIRHQLATQRQQAYNQL